MEQIVKERQILDNINDACYELNNVGTIVYVNKKAEQLFRRKKITMLNRNVWDAFPELKATSCFDAIQLNALQKKLPAKFEYQSAITKTWISLEAIPIDEGCVVFFHEIEELKQAQNKYRELIDTMPDVITRWNKELKLIFANRALGSKMGQAIDKLYGKDQHEMGLPDEVALPWMESFRKAFVTGREVTYYGVMPSPTGAVHFQSRIIPEKNKLGEVQTIMSIARDISDLKKAEQEVMDLRLRQQKKILNAIILTQEQERERIGEALHNGVAQLLYGILTRLQQNGVSDPEQLKELIRITTEAIQETKRISFELIPAVLKDHGIEIALRSLLQRITVNAPLIEFNIQKLRKRFSEKLEFAVYRIVQELLSNCIKHAQASKVIINIREQEQLIHLEVKDNGIGFDIKGLEPMEKGIGLQSIKNRIKLLEGTFKVHSSEKGTTVLVEIPC